MKFLCVAEFVAQVVRALPDNSGGDAADQYIRWNIFRDDSPRRDDGPIADDAGQDRHPCSNVGVIVNDDWAADFPKVCGIYVMLTGVNPHLSSDVDARANRDAVAGVKKPSLPMVVFSPTDRPLGTKNRARQCSELDSGNVTPNRR